MRGPERYVNWINKHLGFNPRSATNSNAFAKGLVRPKFKTQVVRDTVKIFEAIPLRESPEDPNDLPEALAVIVVNYDGINPAILVTGDVSPDPKSPAHYDNFIARLAAKYEDRF